MESKAGVIYLQLALKQRGLDSFLRGRAVTRGVVFKASVSYLVSSVADGTGLQGE